LGIGSNKSEQRKDVYRRGTERTEKKEEDEKKRRTKKRTIRKPDVAKYTCDCQALSYG